MASQQNARSPLNPPPPSKSGESGDLLHVQGPLKSPAEFCKFMSQKTAGGRSRLDTVWERLYLSAAGGDTKAAMFIVEQTQGRASGADPLAFADHLRRVERDRIEVALRILGSRVMVMDQEQLLAFIEELAGKPEFHLKEAEGFLRGEHRTLKLPSKPDPLAGKGEETGGANG